MQTWMRHVIRAYVQATNERDNDAFGALFTKDAIVHDEGQEHRGVAAIQKWLAATVRKYAFTLTLIDFSQERDKAILSGRMEGNFPGSPLSARFGFVLREGKIAKLDISA